MWIDAHAHLSQQPRNTLARHVTELKRMGCRASIQGGVGPEDWSRQLELAREFPDFVRPVLGLHPWWVLEHTREESLAALTRLEPMLTCGGVGLGELGLDYFRDKARDASGLQREVFEAQLEIASRHRLPLVLHVVHAHAQALEILKRHAPQEGGIVHAFSGAFEIAQEYLALGFKLSIGPGLAQPGRFMTLKKALPRLGLSDWVLESDDQGPELLQAARAAAGLLGLPVEQVLEQTSRTARQVFGL